MPTDVRHQRRPVAALLLVVGTLIGGSTNPAHADAGVCALTCGGTTARLIAPADGETAVPTNAVASVRWEGATGVGLTDLALRDEGGTDLAALIEVVPWANPYVATARLYPTASLAPGGLYSVVRPSTGEVLGTFSVGTGADDAPPPAAGDWITGDDEAIACGDACCPEQAGHLLAAIHVSLSPSPPGTTEQVLYVIRKGEFPEDILAADVVGPAVGYVNCAGAALRCGDAGAPPWFELAGAWRLELSVAARDRAGHESSRSFITGVGYCGGGGDGPIAVSDGGPVTDGGPAELGGDEIGCGVVVGRAPGAGHVLVFLALLMLVGGSALRRHAWLVVLASLLLAAPASAALLVAEEQAVDAPVPAPNPSGGFFASSATDGTNWLITWYEVGARERVRAGRLAVDGTALDLVPIAVPASDRRQLGARVAFDGTHFVVAWTEYDPAAAPGDATASELLAMRIAADGTPVDATPLHVATGATGVMDMVATDGVVLITWMTQAPDGVPNAVRFARVANGVLRDPVPIVAAAATLPNYVFGGDSACAAGICLVTWADCGTQCEQRGLRVDAATGAILDATPLTLPPGKYPHVASNGAGWLLAYVRQDVLGDGGHIAVALVDAAGGVTDLPALTLSGPWTQFLDVAYDGDAYLVTWQERRNAQTGEVTGWAARISPGGVLLDPSGGFSLGEVPHANGFSCLGGRCAVPASATGPGGSALPNVLFVENGAPLPFPAIAAYASNNQTAPSVAQAADGYLAVWSDRRGADGTSAVWAAALDTTGAAVAPSFAVASATGSPQAWPQVGWDGDSYVVVWIETDVGGRTVRAARRRAGEALEPPGGVALSGASVTEASPRLACAPTTACLVAWVENPAPYDVRASGVLVPPGADIAGRDVLRLSDVDSFPYQIAVAAAQHGFLVAWRGGSLAGLEHVRASLVQLDGAVNAGTVRIADSLMGLGWEVAAASDGDNYLVTWGLAVPTSDACWSQGDQRCQTVDLVGTRITSGGEVLEDAAMPLRIEATWADSWNPAVAWTGHSYLVTWSEPFVDDCADPLAYACTTPRRADLRAARVSRGGLIVDLPSMVVSAFDDDEGAPSVTSRADGTALIVYQRLDLAPGLGSNRVRVRLVTGDDTADDYVPPPSPRSWGCRAAPASAPAHGLELLVVLALVASVRRRHCNRARARVR